MLRQLLKYDERAQSLLEYIIVIGVIISIIFAMSSLVQRGTQGMIKVVADQLGDQQNGDQPFEQGGYLESSYTSTRTLVDKTRSEFLGNIGYIYQDVDGSGGNAFVNLGYTNET